MWLAPRTALKQQYDGLIELAPPQIMSLVHLAHHASAASLLAEARGRMPPLIEPQSFERDGVRVACYPGDEFHSVRERALPGATRLHQRKGRFEPPGGFDSLFS